MLTIEDRIPDFDLMGVVKEDVRNYKLKNYVNKWVVLFFYPFDFSELSSQEILGLQVHAEALKKQGVEVFGISTDSAYSHLAWLKEIGELTFPLLSDSNKRLAHQIGVLDEVEGAPYRATLILDGAQNIRWITVSSFKVGRKVSLLPELLQALQSGKSSMPSEPLAP